MFLQCCYKLPQMSNIVLPLTLLKIIDSDQDSNGLSGRIQIRKEASLPKKNLLERVNRFTSRVAFVSVPAEVGEDDASVRLVREGVPHHLVQSLQSAVQGIWPVILNITPKSLEKLAHS